MIIQLIYKLINEINSEAVVKIFIDCGDGHLSGSGFFVSPTVICTAAHIGYSFEGRMQAGFHEHLPNPPDFDFTAENKDIAVYGYPGTD